MGTQNINISLNHLIEQFGMAIKEISTKGAKAKATEAWLISTLPHVATEIVVFAICVSFVRQRLRRRDLLIISLSAAIVSFVALGDGRLNKDNILNAIKKKTIQVVGGSGVQFKFL